MSLTTIAYEFHTQHAKPAADRWVACMRDVMAAGDDVDRQIVALLIAAEQQQRVAADAVALLRRELLASMQADGVMSFETDHHTVSRFNPARGVDIVDLAAFKAAHPDLMKRPEPTPDRAEIRKRLMKGEQITGATLDNGGDQTLRISSKKG